MSKFVCATKPNLALRSLQWFFSEKYPSLARYGRCTTRMAKWLYNLCRTRSIAKVTADVGWTRPKLDRLFHRLATAMINQRQQEVPEAIGIDEFAVLRRHQYHTVITDLNGRCTHEILEGRSKRTILDFLQTLQDPGQVKIVVMDMWDAYRQAFAPIFPSPCTSWTSFMSYAMPIER